MFYCYLSIGDFRHDSANVDLVEFDSLVVDENSLTIEYLDAKNLNIFERIEISAIQVYLIFYILLDDILLMKFSFNTFALLMCNEKPNYGANDTNGNRYCNKQLKFKLHNSKNVDANNANRRSEEKYKQAKWGSEIKSKILMNHE